MAYWWASRMIGSLFDAIFRPARFVAGRTTAVQGSRRHAFRQFGYFLGVYLVNLVLYAGPLTLAGFGVQDSSTPPTWFVRSAVTAFGEPVTLWQLLSAFLQNCAFLTVATGLTLITFHTGVLLSRSSRGLLLTVRTVVYSTSVYLAGIFTVIWYLSTQDGVVMARRLVIAIQKAFIYYFIDVLNADLGLPGGRPETVLVTDLSQTGLLALAILGILAIYYLLSLYLGTRVNHRTTRTTGLIVVGFVALSPALYVIGLVIVYAGVP